MLTMKHKQSSLNYLAKAIKASSGGEQSFRNNELSLVGLAYSTDILEEEVLCHTALNNVIFQGDGMTATITLKPLPSQVPMLKTLEESFTLIGGGAFIDDVKVMEPVFSTPLDVDLLMGNSMFSNIQDYNMELHLEEADVSFMETKLAGEVLYQFVVESSLEATTGGIKQHLTLLFKPKVYDNENLFSTLLVLNKDGAPKPKLDKRDTKKMLDIIMEPNLTGLLLGSAMFKPQYNSVTAVVYPLNANMQIAESENSYHVIADTGTIILNKKDIKYSTVKKVSQGKYLLSIYVSDGVLSLSLG